jgi:hypothetical protein
MTFRPLVVVTALFTLATLSAPADATVVVVPELPELAQKTEVIVHATVTAQDVVKHEGHTVTRTTIAVRDGIKGAKEGDTLVIHQIGGTRDGQVTWIAGAHRFRVGEEMVLFAARWPKHGPAAIMPYGVGYGVFDIVEDPSGALVVREQIGDITTMKRGAEGKLERSHPTARSWISVDAFKDEVRGFLAGPPARDFKKPVRMTVGGGQ